MTKCACGCGEEIPRWCTWKPGHHFRVQGLNPMHDSEVVQRNIESRKGYIHSQETIDLLSKRAFEQDARMTPKERLQKSQRLSESLKGHPHSEEHNQRVSEAMKGRPKSEDHKRALSEANFGKLLSHETCEKMSRSQMGHPVSIDTRKAISKAQLGKSVTEETRRQISLSLIGRFTGESSPNWRGGYIGYYGIGWWATKERIRDRDNQACQISRIYIKEKVEV